MLNLFDFNSYTNGNLKQRDHLMPSSNHLVKIGDEIYNRLCLSVISDIPQTVLFIAF